MGVKIVTVSELKAKLASVVAQLETDGIPLYVTQYGKPKAVLVHYGVYEALRDRLDDLEDVLAMRDAMLRPGAEAVSLDEFENKRASRLRG